MRLVAGSIVLTTILGSLAAPKLKWLAAGIGAGLAGAALTNTCAMGMALSKLPYNRGGTCDAQTVVCQTRRRRPEGELTDMIALTVALAVVVGISLGLFGGGGSILTVPLLAYVAGMEPKHAIATSLLVVGATSAIAAITHARAGRVRWRIAVVFGLVAMAGAYAGGLVARFIPGTVLLVAFAVIMILAGLAMLRGRKDSPGTDAGEPLPVVRIVLLGTGVGLISGLVGAGGGFLLVPALALLAGLPMPIAVGTSLVVISTQSFAGLAGHLASEQIDWQLAAFVTAAAVVGALIGGRLIAFVNQATLRRIFGRFILLMASVVLAEEVNPEVGVATAGLTVMAAGIAFACTRYAHCPLRRLVDQQPVSAAAA